MEKARIIQELVPGKQVTIAHLIAHPDEDLAKKMGVPGAEAVGILTLSPREAAMIAGDFATKAALHRPVPPQRARLCRMRNDQELSR